MLRKYFTAFCNMNSTDLRANMFHHSCLVFFEADCNENEEIIYPIRFIDAYGFYSHPIPYQKSFFEEPFTFLCQQVGIGFRLRGSFGEWKQEAIHDLTYGRGLTGRLFEMNEDQFFHILTHIQQAIEKQKEFLAQATELIDQEEMYNARTREKYIAAIKKGSKPAEASKIAEKQKPLPEFKFSVTGRGNTCKLAALDMIADCYDKNSTILAYIENLKGSTFTSAIPRLTNDLDDIILHCRGDQWEARGDKNKYPYYDWPITFSDTENILIAISPGSWYVDKDGCAQSLLAPEENHKELIKNLKVIGRLCEININHDTFKDWHNKINHYLLNLATCVNKHQQELRYKYADNYLEKLINSSEFKDIIIDHIPSNLHSLLQKVIQQYEYVAESELRYYSY